MVYDGIELKISIDGRLSGSFQQTEPMSEQVVEVLSGKISITPKEGTKEIFLVGDYFMIPAGFVGLFEYEGHGLVRTMHIHKS